MNRALEFKFVLLVVLVVVMSSCVGNGEKVATKSNVEVKDTQVPTSTMTPTQTPEPTKTLEPTQTESPTLTPKPTETQVPPTPTPETYGREVVWLKPEIQDTFDTIKEIIRDTLPYERFTMELKDPVVDIWNLPDGVKCYGWEQDGSIKCLYAKKGVDYYCEYGGWPKCYPYDYEPEDEKLIKGTFLVLYEGILESFRDPSGYKDYLTSEMRVGQNTDVILAVGDIPTIQFEACMKSLGDTYSTVFAVPLPQLMGLGLQEKANIKVSTISGKTSCEQQFTIWDINPTP